MKQTAKTRICLKIVKFLVAILPGICLFAFASSGYAQQYRFSVPNAQMLVTVNEDASIKIAYEFEFHNARHASPIDVVDIGTPHSGYNLQNISAWIGNHRLHDIRHSTYIKPGFEIHLGASTIMPGDRGTLRVEFTMPRMIYSDTTRSDYASLHITPTWFDPRCIQGTTHLRVAVQLPKSVRPEEVLHQGLNFTLTAATDNGALVGWDFPGAKLSHANMVKLSFPRRDLKQIVHVTAVDLLLRWFAASTAARFVLAVIFLLLFAIFFFRFTGGTGVSLFLILSIAACVLFVISPGLHLLSLPIVVVLIGINEWLLNRRKQHYMPPIAMVEGGGIKRGLTAPEAAVLLELPLPKVLSLVIFGMLKKGILRQVQAEPLTVEVNETLQLPQISSSTNLQAEQDHAFREKAVKYGIVVHDYELPFLFLLQNNPRKKPVSEFDFSLPIKKLIQSVAARMKGFDLQETKEYYRSIVRRAVEQATSIGDIQQREKTIDRNFEWILMDKDYPTVFRGPYRPVWHRGTFFPVGSGDTVTEMNIPNTPTFSDVTSSFAGWVENTMGNLASAITPETLNLPSPGSGFIDLTMVDQAASSFLQSLAESGGSRGGGGGCACACAGCACACACAGGGR